MHRTLLLGLLALLTTTKVHGQNAVAERLALVQDGRAVCTIVVPAQPDPWTVQAARWLKEYVERSSGAELKIVAEGTAPAGPLISVGHTELAKQAGIDVADLKWDGGKLIVRGDVLYLLGRDSTREIKGRPRVGARGTSRAVLTFLEDACGVRWFLPTPEGELVPRSRDLSVPRSLAKTAVPAFAYSDGRPAYSPGFLGDGGDTPASIINNFRLSVGVMTGGHTYYHAVPAEKYFGDHPEYFALINGQRTRAGNHLCTSNPDVRQLLLRWTQERLDDGIDWVSIGQEDGFLRCECTDCEKLDSYRYSARDGEWEQFQAGRLREAPCERLFVLHKWVIDEIRKTHPDRKVNLMCYAPTAWPSKTISHFGDNVIGELTNLEPAYIEAWKDRVAGLTGQVIWFNIQCPMGMNVQATPREVAEKIRYLHRNRFIGLAQYAETNWGFQGPAFYVLGKMMGDPSLDHQKLVEEYCRGVFAKAADPMLAFFNLLYGRLEDVLPVAVEDFEGRNTRLPRWITTSEMYLMQYRPSLLDRLEAHLSRAEREADGDRARGWVRHTRDYFDFTKLLTHALISHRAWQANPTPENWRELADRVDAFDAYRLKILTYPAEYTARWFPGHGQFCNWMTADCRKEGETYYVPWEQRRPDVLKRGIKGMAMGHGASYYYSFVKEPLTLDFRKQP